MTKIENQTAVTFTGETTKLPSGQILMYYIGIFEEYHQLLFYLKSYIILDIKRQKNINLFFIRKFTLIRILCKTHTVLFLTPSI